MIGLSIAVRNAIYAIKSNDKSNLFDIQIIAALLKCYEPTDEAPYLIGSETKSVCQHALE